jgi:hypothetical protein
MPLSFAPFGSCYSRLGWLIPAVALLATGAAQVDARPVVWAPPTLISDPAMEATTGSHYYDNQTRTWHNRQVAVGGSGSGTAAVVWTEFDGQIPKRVMSRVFSSGSWGDPDTVWNSSRRIENPTVAVGANGYIHVAYQQWEAGPPEWYDIAYQVSTDGGGGWTSPRWISPVDDEEITQLMPEGGASSDTCDALPIRARNPSLLVDASGNVFATWWQVRNALDQLQQSPVDSCQITLINGTLLGSRLGSSDVASGAWSAPFAISDGSWDYFGVRSLEDCGPPHFLWRPSYRTGPAPHEMVLDSGGDDIYFLFKDDPFEKRRDGLPPAAFVLDANGPTGDPIWIGTGIGGLCHPVPDNSSDHYFLKRGSWTGSEFVFLGGASGDLGTDVRATPRSPDFESGITVPDHPMNGSVPPSVAYTTLPPVGVGSVPRGTVVLTHESASPTVSHALLDRFAVRVRRGVLRRGRLRP